MLEFSLLQVNTNLHKQFCAINSNELAIIEHTGKLLYVKKVCNKQGKLHLVTS